MTPTDAEIERIYAEVTRRLQNSGYSLAEWAAGLEAISAALKNRNGKASNQV